MKIYKNKQGFKLICEICKKSYAHLGSHIYHSHEITAREYKEEYELPYKMSLISIEIYQKKREHFNENREKYLKRLLKDNGHRFKKGQDSHRRISKYEKIRYIERIKNLNINKKGKLEQCPICKTKHNHLESHLYNKHKLLKV